MPSLMEQVQTNIRAVTGTAGMYWEDWHALCTQASIPPGQINERVLAYYNKTNTGPATFDSAHQYYLHNPGLIASYSPASQFASGQPGVWYDPSSFANLYQDSAGTTPVTATGQPDGLMLDNSGRLNHISQATASARPIVNASNGAQYLTFDGVDDGMSTGTITLTAAMDCFIAVRRNSSAGGMLCSSADTANFFGCFEAGVNSTATNNSGNTSYLVNGTAVPGGTSVSRGQLATAINVGSWSIVEVQDLALSAYAGLYLMRWVGGGSFYVNGDFGGIILCPAGDATNRANNRKWLGAKVGLSL